MGTDIMVTYITTALGAFVLGFIVGVGLCGLDELKRDRIRRGL